MDSFVARYYNGAAVHAGDRVRYKGQAGNVVFVSDGQAGEFSPGYTDYLGYEPGIMVMSDEGELMFIIEPDDNLELIRGHAPAHV